MKGVLKIRMISTKVHTDVFRTDWQQFHELRNFFHQQFSVVLSNRPANDIDGVARREASKRTFVAILYTGINDSFSIVGKGIRSTS